MVLPPRLWTSCRRQSNLFGPTTRRKFATAIAYRANLLARALGMALAAFAIVQIHIAGHWSDGASTQSPTLMHQPAQSHAGRFEFISLDNFVSDEFRPSARPWRADQFYKGFPVSPFRPTGQFYVRPSVVKLSASSWTENVHSPHHRHQQPSSLPSVVMTILTATRNPSEVFFSRTVRFVLEQSLQAFRWVVVNDHSTEARSLRRLKELKRWAEHHEPSRILIVDNPSSTTQGNGPAAMNYGLRFVGDSPFVSILDDDDMWELTTLEKAALVMAWVPDAYAVSFDVVNHGDEEFSWKRGFYNGDESFFHENNLMQGSPFRSSVLIHCRFREDMADGGADWDFWICMASHGMWGLHVPENGNWYQWNPPDFRKRRWKAVTTHKAVKDTRDRIQRRYPNLFDDNAWPHMVLPPSTLAAHNNGSMNGGSHAFSGQDPFINPVGLRAAALSNQGAINETTTHRCILLAIRDLGNHFVADQALQITRELAEAGWRVTMLLTHYLDGDEATARRHQQLLQYTHDVFVAGTVAPLDKLPDLVAYLLESRGTEVAVVLQDHSASSQSILRHLVAAAAALRGLRHATDQASGRGRPMPIAVIDIWPMNGHLQCGDEEGSDQFSAKSSSPRNAMWFAVIQTSSVATRDEKIKECLTKRGYAKVMILVESTNDAAITMGYVLIAIQATHSKRTNASPTSERNDRSMLGFEPWPAFIRRLDLSLSNSQQRQERGLDMRRIQLALQYRKNRFGFGRELQIACPERVYANSRWIDGLEAPVTCAEGGSAKGNMLDVPSLRTNAMRQCGAWCLTNMDGLRDGTDANTSLDKVGGSVLGWEFTGSCFRPITLLENSSKCAGEIFRAMQSA
jgi:hypothetical protein